MEALQPLKFLMHEMRIASVIVSVVEIDSIPKHKCMCRAVKYETISGGPAL